MRLETCLSPGQSRPFERPSRMDIGISILLVAILTTIYWPGFNADWVRDDFIALAFVRMLDSPWPLFYQDHFHVPAANFRPLGYTAFWVNQAFFGNGFRANIIGDWLIHVGATLALYRLLRQCTMSTPLAALCTLLFAVHPAVLSDALWYSARFDHLAILFSFIALSAAYTYRDSPRTGDLLLVLISSMLAMLSKEIGLVVILPISALWLSTIRRSRARLWPGLLGLWGLVAVYFLWRWLVLGTAASHLTRGSPLFELFWTGFHIWLANLPGYLSFLDRLDSWTKWTLCLGLAILASSILFGIRNTKIGAYSDRAGDFFLTGLMLLLLPGLLQAPIVAINAIPLSNQVSAVEVAMQSRLYGMSLGGLALIVAAILDPLLGRSPSRTWSMLTVPALAVLVAGLANVAWQTANAYRARSVEIAKVAHLAVDTLGHHQLPKHLCRIYISGVKNAPEWDIYVSMASIIKALSPDIDRVDHCLINSDYVTFLHFLPAGQVQAEGSAPYLTKMRAPPLRRVGNVEMFQLAPPPVFSSSSDPHGLYLAFENGKFNDVSEQIKSGLLTFQYR